MLLYFLMVHSSRKPGENKTLTSLTVSLNKWYIYIICVYANELKVLYTTKYTHKVTSNWWFSGIQKTRKAATIKIQKCNHYMETQNWYASDK